MTLASQAAVAIVENQGNLSKALKALGSNASVKALATSMVIGGALAGFDTLLGTTTAPQNVKLPVLNDGDWSKVAQRIAGQSVISSGVDTAINGGSYKDKLTSALLSNIGNQVNAQGARLIGDNGQVLTDPGRMVSHAVVSAISAEIAGGNAKGAAAGALAAELAGIILEETYIRPEEWKTKSEQLAQMTRALGGITGAIFTGEASGAYSGAQSSEITFKYNYLSHQQQQQMEAELLSASTFLDKALIMSRYGLISGTQDGAFIAGAIASVPVGFQETVQDMLALAQNWQDALGTLKSIFAQTDALAMLGNAIREDYINRIDNLVAQYQKAGTQGAFNAGLEFGKLTTEIAGLIVGAGIAKSGLHLTTKSIKAYESISQGLAHRTVDIREVYRIEKDGTKVQMSWDEGNYPQGMPYEDFVAGILPEYSRLPEGFKTFDFFDELTREATSVKTYNTQTASRLEKTSQIYSYLKSYVDDILKFTEYRKGEVVLYANDIALRRLEIAVPDMTNAEQWQQINRVIQYGSDNGVKVTITAVKK